MDYDNIYDRCMCRINIRDTMGDIRTIKFNEALHTYTDEFNNPYTPVTSAIGKYHEHFNENEWALKKSLDQSPYNPYRGMSVSEIKSQWKDTREFSQEKGNKTHKVLEDSINEANGKASFEFEKDKIRLGKGTGTIEFNKTNIHILAETPLAKKYPLIFIHLRKYIEDGWTLYAEKRIYWFPYLIAGTIDCLLVKGKFFMIVDWKTNKKKLEFRSGYYKKFQGIETTEWINKNERFYFPLNKIPFCKGHIYTLQLSLYALLMELWGFKCIGLTLFHILNDVPQPPITIAYWKQDCLNLCSHFSQPSNINSSNKKNTNQDTSFGIF